MLEIEQKARLLSAEGKPYSFDGRSGTSFKARFLIGSSIFPVKCNEQQIKDLQQYLEKDITVVLNLSAPKENIALSFGSVVKK